MNAAIRFQHEGRCFDRESAAEGDEGKVMKQNDQACWWVTLSLTCVAGCATPIDAPSAYADQQFLCGAEKAAEFDHQVERCREASLRDGSCSGIVSLNGVLDTYQVVIDATVTQATYSEKTGKSDGSGGELSETRVLGHAPYFSFTLSVLSRPLDPGIQEAPGVCRDLRGFLAIEARGGNDNMPMYYSTCDLKLRTPQEIWMVFSADVRLRGNLEGCFHIFPKIII
jgi:hypothetical protein